MCCGSQVVSDELTLCRESDIMFPPMERQHPLHRRLKLTSSLQFISKVPRVESYLWIPLSLENTVSHVIVTRADTRVAAPGVDDDGTASFSSSGVCDDASSFKFESSMCSVQGARQTKFNQCL